MNRLKNGMALATVFATMAGHNRGALIAMKHIHASDSGRQIISLLDHYGVYGTDLYVLYNDKCHGLVRKLHTLLMATHTGLMARQDLMDLAKDQMGRIHFTEELCTTFETTMRKVHEQTQKAKKRAQNNPGHDSGRLY